MGVVYQAHDPQIDRPVALKVLRPDRVSTEAFRQRFLKEARAVGRLSHPSIVVVYDIGEDHGTIYISMEYLEGKPLSDLIQQGRLTEDEAIHLGIQVAEALDYAHRRGIVHRDIKPSNIIVQPDGQVKITDFGIAHIDDPDATQQTQAGEILGTPAYMAPEQVLGQQVDGRTDLFSLGVILYELCVGHRPFRAESLATIFHAITHEDPPQPVLANPALGTPLSQAIMRCLAKEPADRFATGKDLTEVLKICRGSPETIQIAPPTDQAPQPTQPSPLIWIALTLLLVVGGTAGIFVVKQALRSPSIEDAATPRAPSTQDASGSSAPSQSLSGKTGTALDRAETDRMKADPAPQAIEERKPAGGIQGPAGSLRLESKPLGAQVLVNGEVRGLTPIEIKLPPGSHEVRLSMENHGDWEAQVRIAENQRTVIPVELIRMP